LPTRVAHLWLVTDRESFRPGSSFFHRNQEQGFYSLLFLAQAMADENLPTPLEITVVTSGAAQVRAEPLPHPEKSTVLGPARVLPRELPGITCRLLDATLPAVERPSGLLALGRVRPAEDPLSPLAARVLEDLFAAPTDTIAALRGSKRLELEFAPQPLPPATAPALRTGGVCLITGGFGGIGQSVAESLVRASQARLVLVGRAPLPPRTGWALHLRRHGPNDPTSRRIRAVERLESLGAEVLVAAADVCNPEEMRAAVAAATERFGGIDAVIHAAGVIDDGPLLAKTQGAIEDVLSPKVHGTMVLDALFPDGSLDWLALFSSTSTITAPAGQVDYVAANEFLNAYAKSRSGGRTRVVAINWGIWSEVGMAATALAERLGEAPKAAREPAAPPLLDSASFDDKGHRIFESALSAASHWVVDEHRTRSGNALLPGTGYLELAAESLQAHGELGAFEVRDLHFLRPLTVEDGRGRDIRVRLTRSDEGYRLEVLGAVRVDGRDAFELNAQATLAIWEDFPKTISESSNSSGSPAT
jgi:NAD(P)-dependent dehydrogenase (short-subunit alcohol dehydrogenase family)